MLMFYLDTSCKYLPPAGGVSALRPSVHRSYCASRSNSLGPCGPLSGRSKLLYQPCGPLSHQVLLLTALLVLLLRNHKFRSLSVERVPTGRSSFCPNVDTCSRWAVGTTEEDRSLPTGIRR